MSSGPNAFEFRDTALKNRWNGVFAGPWMGEQSNGANNDRYEKHPNCHAVSHHDLSKTFSRDFQFSKRYAKAYSG
jgi:hypothetical protein